MIPFEVDLYNEGHFDKYLSILCFVNESFILEMRDLFYPPSCDRPQPIPGFPYFMNYLYKSGPLQFDELVFQFFGGLE